MNVLEIIRRPVVTEKAVAKKENERTLCLEVAPDATKVQIRAAVEKVFKVKVESIRTCNNLGKLRRRGRFAGFRSDWKKAYVKLKDGQKVPEYAEI